MNIFELLCVAFVVAFAWFVSNLLGASYGLWGYVFGVLAGAVLGLCVYYMLITVVAVLLSIKRSDIFREGLVVVDSEADNGDYTNRDPGTWLVDCLKNSGYRVAHHGRQDAGCISIRFFHEDTECYCKVYRASESHDWRCILRYDPGFMGRLWGEKKGDHLVHEVDACLKRHPHIREVQWEFGLNIPELEQLFRQ